MKRRKSFVLLSILLLCVYLVSCVFFADKRDDDIRFHRRESFVRDEIIKALDNQDATALKNLFSNETISRIDNIDEKIKEYIEFYKGTSISYKSKSGSESGLPTYRFDHWYEVSTDADEYVIYFDFFSRDEAFEKENKEVVSDIIGLHSIVILRKELADEIVYNPWPHSDGIFIYYTIDDYLDN